MQQRLFALWSTRLSITHRQTRGAVVGDVILIVSLPRIPWGRTPDAVALLLGFLKRKKKKEGNAVSLRKRLKNNRFFSAFVDVTFRALSQSIHPLF